MQRSWGHFWSLAIEEQFYLVWPFVLASLCTAKLIRVCTGIIIAALGLRIAVALTDFGERAQYFLYFSTATRLDCLAFGAMGAVLTQFAEGIKFLRRSAVPLFLVSGVALIAIFAMKTYSPIWNHAPMLTVGLTLTGSASLGAVAFMLTASPDSPARILMRSAILGVIGRYSYAMYIFHWPAIVITSSLAVRANLGPISSAVVLGTIPAGLTCLGAWLSWNVIEKPTLALRAILINSANRVVPTDERITIES